MQHEAIDGLVLRVRNKGDTDRYLSVLTAEQGRITVLSKGSRSLRSEQMGISQLFTYSNFEVYRRKDLRILKGGSAIKSFHTLSVDLDFTNLASYLCDVVIELTDQGEEAGDMLRLLLNSFYAICERLYPLETVKAAFELRAAAMSGYMPELDGCRLCGASGENEIYLDVMNGALLCSDCLQKKGRTERTPTSYDDIREAELLCPLSPAALAAMRYVLSASLSRVFAFELGDPNDLRAFTAAAETYLLSHIGHGFDTLDFYHTMREPIKGTK